MAWTGRMGLWALLALSLSCGSAHAPPVSVQAATPGSTAGSDTSNPVSIAADPNVMAHDPNAPIMAGQGPKPAIGTDGWVAFDIQPSLGNLADVQTAFVIGPSFDPNNPAVLSVFTQALQGNTYLQAACPVHDGFCRVLYTANGNVTSSPNVAFAVGDIITAHFTDLGGGQVAMQVSNPNTQQGAALTVHAPAMSVLYLADTGGGTAKDAIFSNTAVTFSAPAAPACWPVTRGPRDSVVTPLFSTNALHCLAPEIVLRAKGTTPSDPTPPQP